MAYTPSELIYEGKAKQIYAVNEADDLVIMKFKDSLTAFNAQKKAELGEKGITNLKISGLIFDRLIAAGIPTHFVEQLSDTELVVKRLKIVPVEVVVRNILAGSTAKRFGRKEGEKLSRPLVEYYLKEDDLNDPLMTVEQADILGFAKKETLADLKELALKINDLLMGMFAAIDIDLVDFKLEFGRDEQGQVYLADEISPDSCRLWDQKSGEKMDKDRFRRDLGSVLESYQEVLRRLSANQ